MTRKKNIFLNACDEARPFALCARERRLSLACVALVDGAVARNMDLKRGLIGSSGEMPRGKMPGGKMQKEALRRANLS
jgi:hypothetical protein